MATRRYPETSNEHDEHRDVAVLVGIDRSDIEWPIEESLAELQRLAETADIDVKASVTQRLDRPNPRTFIGPGKAEQVAAKASEVHADLVIFDDELTPSQQLNLEGIMPEVRVIDRTALILEIFALHAVTREGKLQVELAQQEYVLPRLRGMWGHLEKERLGGGRGTRFGAGESQLESDRRIARRRIADLKRELKSVASERDLQRKRRSQSGIFRAALVGYTNAGKSTLLNALTGAGVLAEDKLFATLDSTTRRLSMPDGREVTLTDTVGFINKLPHGLVEAFKSTLDEVNEADLLILVTDASAEQRDAQMASVRKVLEEIGAKSKPAVTVFNKIDLLPPEERESLAQRYRNGLLVSAAEGKGIDALIARIADQAARGDATITVLVPYTRGGLVRTAHERTNILSERHTDDGTRLVLRAPKAIAEQFSGFLVNPADDEPRDDAAVDDGHAPGGKPTAD